MTVAEQSDAGWLVRPLARDCANIAPKLVSLLPREPATQCGHLAQAAAATEWGRRCREKRKDFRFNDQNFDPEKCSMTALYTVGGLPVCSRHAGLILLDACLELGV